MSSETQLVPFTTPFSFRSVLRHMARCLLALSVLSVPACMWPAKTTYYEAVDKSPMATATEGNLARCPSYYYDDKYLESGRISVVPSYQANTGHIYVLVSVRHGYPHTFQALSIQLTSLTDPIVQASLSLTFFVNCLERSIQSCPKVPSEPTLNGPESVTTNLVENFVGFAAVPPELVSGFILELQDTGHGPSVDLGPQKFALRTSVIWKGTFGCFPPPWRG
jgi:hypothetical protein